MKIAKSSFSTTSTIAAFLTLVFSFTLSINPCLADRDDDYNDGVEAYNRGNFRIANQFFQDAIKEGNSAPIVMLYLAHSYAAQGQYKLALPIYRNIRDSFKGTPESAQAAGCCLRLENPAAYAATKGKGKVTFYNRIKSFPPKKGHAPVSKATIASVQKAIMGMPRALYQILDTGAVTVVVAPCAQDKLQANSTLKEPCILLGKEINVFENLASGGKLKPFTGEEIRESFLKQIGRSVDECSGGIARDPDFHVAYKVDLRNLPETIEDTIPFLAPPANLAEQEVCAYLIGGIAGGTTKMNVTISQNFPRTKGWIINKLRLQN